MGLGSILGAIAGIAGIPFTGGGSLAALLPAIGGAVGTVAGGAAKSANESNLINDRNKLNAWDMGENARLARDKFGVTAPGQRLNTSLKASIMDRFKPTTVKWGGPGSGLRGEMPTYEGGFRGAMADLDPSTKSLSQRVMSDMLADQMQGGRTGGARDSYMTPQPEIGKGSKFGNIMGGIGLGGSILGALKGIKFGNQDYAGGE